MTRKSCADSTRTALRMMELLDLVDPKQRGVVAHQKPYEQCLAALRYQYKQGNQQALDFIVNAYVKKNPEWIQGLLVEAVKSNNEEMVAAMLRLNGGDAAIALDYPKDVLEFIVKCNDSSGCDLVGAYDDLVHEDLDVVLSAHMQLTHRESMALWVGLADDVSDDSSDDGSIFAMVDDRVQRIVADRAEPYTHKLSVLQLAVERDQPNLSIVKRLLACGVDVNARNPFGETVLFSALRLKHYDIAQLLLSHDGVDLTLQNDDGQTALHVLVCSISSLSSECDDDNQLLALLKTMLQLGGDVNAKDSMGGSVLFRALHSRKKAFFDLLLDAGADVDQCNRQGVTVLERALDVLSYDPDGIVLRLIESSNDVDRACRFNYRMLSNDSSALGIAAGDWHSRTNPRALVYLLKKSKKTADEKMNYLFRGLARIAERGIVCYYAADRGILRDVIHGCAFKTDSLDRLRQEQEANEVDAVLMKLSEPGCTMQKLLDWLEKFGMKRDSIGCSQQRVLSGMLRFFNEVSFLLRYAEGVEDFADACMVLKHLELYADNEILINVAVDRERNWRGRRALCLVRDLRRLARDRMPKSDCRHAAVVASPSVKR